MALGFYLSESETKNSSIVRCICTFSIPRKKLTPNGDRLVFIEKYIMFYAASVVIVSIPQIVEGIHILLSMI